MTPKPNNAQSFVDSDHSLMLAELAELKSIVAEVSRRLERIETQSVHPRLYIQPDDGTDTQQPSDTTTANTNHSPNTAFLFYSLFLLLLGAPLFEGFPLRERLLEVIVDSVLLVAVFSIWRQHETYRTLALVFCVTTGLINVYHLMMEVEWMRLTGIGFQLCIFGVTIASLALMIVRSSKVNINVIYASLSKFILIGVFWGCLYNLLDGIDPGAFAYSDIEAGPLNAMDFIYFSLITLTTVGFGDITPVSPVARSLATVEASIGVLYVAVLISRLVSLYERDASQNQPSTAPS